MATPLEIAIRYLHTMSAGDLDAGLSMLTSDAKITTPTGRSVDRESLRGLVDLVKDIIVDGITLTITNTLVDGDRVALEGKGIAKLTNGGVYENHFAWMIETADGKITAFTEYSDTVKAAESFGQGVLGRATTA